MGDAKTSTPWYLATTFLFAAATFQVVDGSRMLGIVLFAAAATSLAVARTLQKRKEGQQ